jgi:hypothetical protein
MSPKTEFVRKKSLNQRLIPRNPLIAEVQVCLKAGLPEPVLKEDQGGYLSKILRPGLL